MGKLFTIIMTIISFLSLNIFGFELTQKDRLIRQVNKCIKEDNCVEKLNISMLPENYDVIKDIPADILKEIILRDLEELSDTETVCGGRCVEK